MSSSASAESESSSSSSCPTDGYTLTGAGDASTNGTYWVTGERYNGKYRYRHETYSDYYIQWDNPIGGYCWYVYHETTGYWKYGSCGGDDWRPGLTWLPYLGDGGGAWPAPIGSRECGPPIE